MCKYIIPKTFLFIIFTTVFCTEKSNNQNKITSTHFYVASWNVENLFDPIDDNEKIDEWFTPSSKINWTEERLAKKIDNLSSVIEIMNDGEGPDILGIQEVEHKSLLKMLVNKISLKKEYDIVSFESPDKRGIDNGLLYNTELFSLKHSEAIKIELGNGKTTRDILHTILDFENEEIHIYVNHWPSRRAGLKKTEKFRLATAESLRKNIETIGNFRKSKIIILGDFNDLPSNISVKDVLGAGTLGRENHSDLESFKLINLSYDKFQQGEGTYKYRGNWNMLDQIIISNGLLKNNHVYYLTDSFEIIKPDFVIQQEGKYKGTSLPTYGGRKYLGGYSDHYAIGARFSTVSD